MVGSQYSVLFSLEKHYLLISDPSCVPILPAWGLVIFPPQGATAARNHCCVAREDRLMGEEMRVLDCFLGGKLWGSSPEHQEQGNLKYYIAPGMCPVCLLN